MVFSSVTFLYYFLPITLAIYFLVPILKGSPRLRNIILLAASLVFYAWGEPIYVLILIAQSLVAWIFGLFIEKHRGKKVSRILLIITVAISLSPLLFFKYTDFTLYNIQGIFNLDSRLLGLALPIGISFYTFQILSYTFDLYRGKIQVSKKLLDFLTYVAMFPQLVAGPIVRYADIENELSARKHNLEDIAVGIRRFIIGLGKKVLLANVMGELVDIYKNSNEYSVLFTWLYVIAFTLQIYFDFSGYSDMAIGLGRIFGFKFRENFNYPYIAKSITDFWRRWHISLSSWFKDYVYIPLGGSRTSAFRHIRNIILVWFLTGFWHGADWNFIIWGLYFAGLLLVEKYILKKLLSKLPNFICFIYTMLIVAVSWIIFDTSDISSIGEVIIRLFGFGSDSIAGTSSIYYLRSYLVPILVGIIACTPVPKIIANKLSTKKSFIIIEPVMLGILLILISAYIVDGSFNPFIYFRF